MKSPGWAQLSDSKELLLELLKRVVDRGTMQRTSWDYKEDEEATYTSDDYDRFKVVALRKLIEKRGGDERALDGTREMLVKWLTSHENGT
mmetsp:Transcript_41106/g.60880  ORF Transcript_41106/g.60880 Transcript_41106/m.60880 type:complete len:90 (+) Transcript_41106:935-1204(+)